MEDGGVRDEEDDLVVGGSSGGGPRTLAPLFILVLVLYTCLPLPAKASVATGILVSAVHLFAMIISASQGNEDNRDVWKKVLLPPF